MKEKNGSLKKKTVKIFSLLLLYFSKKKEKKEKEKEWLKTIYVKNIFPP